MVQVLTAVAGKSLQLRSGGRSGWRRLRRILPAVALLVAVLQAQAEEREQPWLEAEAPARLMFCRPRREMYCLVPAPASCGEVAVTAGRVWFGSSSCPSSLIWSDATHAFFLVDCRSVPDQQWMALYLLTHVLPQISGTNVCDPRPVRFYAQRTAGQDLPVNVDLTGVAA